MNESTERNPNAQLLLNRIRTPDGTVLTSYNRHDYKTYTDANGLVYMVDGGLSYLRRNLHVNNPYEEISLYEDDDWEEIRKAVTWGSFDKGNNRIHVPIKQMSRAHIKAILDDGYTGIIVDLMVKEIAHRNTVEISKSERKRMEVQREASYG